MTATSAFAALFGRAPAAGAEAPGRANLIGEHTDYNGGFVLPTPIPLLARVELAPRTDNHVLAVSADLGAPGEVVEYELGKESPGRGWIDHVQGLTRALRAAGHEVCGFEMRIASCIPPGAGLSSSAAVGVALLRALREAFGLVLAPLDLARLVQGAESEFTGARVGIMDPLACSVARAGTALFLDTRELTFEHIPLPAAAELAVVHSGVSHRHAGGGYNVRRAECERAAGLLGVRELRDVVEDDMPRVAALPEPLQRRVRHVVSENVRVLAAVEALRRGDLPELGRLFLASHASQRDDFEVSIPETDLLVELAAEEAGVHGARLTGGGFGGSVVILADEGTAARAAASVAAAYAERSGRRPQVLLPEDRRAAA